MLTKYRLYLYGFGQALNSIMKGLEFQIFIDF